ncbi:molybdopterin-dependent oxidoreductase [Parasediminibacterium sp. JCM 36343]|uniref:molybdopterin-dependent oxidoreductase n=1 Tax=Parasediminibacterium sp. JCM 36343 TaxID=3374279 RepID=UPI00397B3B85
MKEIIVDDKNARQYKRRSLIAFVVFFVMIGVAYASWAWLQHQPNVDGAKAPLRKGLEVNESLFSKLFSKDKLAKEYPVSAASKTPRVNGDLGLADSTFDAAKWKLHVIKSKGDTLLITLDELKKLPKQDIIFDFKCIEGWNQVTHWGGVRFSDFMKKYQLAPEQAMQYVGMVTPDSKYYVGIDMKSMLQPQTILSYEMNGASLPMNQGYPLRLIIPVKYGVKHIKRIGTISFANTKPRDYWAEKGYDYYTGH